ncbi:uncharacterized protein PAC_16136 [Phialocephala subalpina]|uniref:Uncharacterized protein n=1 Tax=Phialocephala subalpina TaxID=576137 RepID=A0A1L7XMF7_9HELO|nr:uncharacterized protein PAC_16136 [Phialocephala subalpina]
MAPQRSVLDPECYKTVDVYTCNHRAPKPRAVHISRCTGGIGFGCDNMGFNCTDVFVNSICDKCVPIEKAREARKLKEKEEEVRVQEQKKREDDALAEATAKLLIETIVRMREQREKEHKAIAKPEGKMSVKTAQQQRVEEALAKAQEKKLKEDGPKKTESLPPSTNRCPIWNTTPKSDDKDTYQNFKPPPNPSTSALAQKSTNAWDTSNMKLVSTMVHHLKEERKKEYDAVAGVKALKSTPEQLKSSDAESRLRACYDSTEKIYTRNQGVPKYEGQDVEEDWEDIDAGLATGVKSMGLDGEYWVWT